ncbi:MAG: hypothetical protein GY725_13615 [bacterium]|nr:hypothetical protein [bacterium]
MLKLTMALMVVLATARLSYEFWRLLFDSGPRGAVDLRVISSFVAEWFSGQPFTGTYPPASYILLWPFLGWIPFPMLRFVWAVSVVFMLCWLICQLERASRIKTGFEKAWFRFFLLSNYATAVVIGNGQLAIHLCPVLLAGILLLHGKKVSWGKEAGASILLLFAMIKPSLSVPFFWVVLFSCGSFRVVLGCVGAYIGLSFAAITFRAENINTIIQTWSVTTSDIDLGYANIHKWSHVLDMGQWSMVFSVLLLLLAGIWIFWRRHADIWILLGIAAIISRIWTYHQLYDDLLILLPVVALFRISQKDIARKKGLDIIAVILIIISWACLIGPGSLLRLSFPLGTVFRAGQTLIWCGILCFLLYWAEKEPIVETGT